MKIPWESMSHREALTTRKTFSDIFVLQSRCPNILLCGALLHKGLTIGSEAC